MRNKKTVEPKESTEEEALKERVDAMMDARRAGHAADSATSTTIGKKSSNGAEETEVHYKNQPSAPPLPGKLLKQLPVEEETPEPEKPYIIPTSSLSIDKLDELTESITSSETSPKSNMSAALETTAKPNHEYDVDVKTEFDDSATDKAIDDIVAKEGDIVLAAEDASVQPKEIKPHGQKDKTPALLKNQWIWLTVLVALGIILVLRLKG